mgnify:FL=1|jgi:hypothetical protein|tara:strand:- start:215 stop:382 length:168 start_codon:yes stop_codon:yes gene_type:complete
MMNQEEREALNEVLNYMVDIMRTIDPGEPHFMQDRVTSLQEWLVRTNRNEEGEKL